MMICGFVHFVSRVVGLISQSDRVEWVNTVYTEKCCSSVVDDSGCVLKGYRASNAYIITQMPLPHTVIDLWRMIYEHKCGTIVMLNPWDESDTVYYCFISYC